MKQQATDAIATAYALLEAPDGVLLAGAFWIVTARGAVD